MSDCNKFQAEVAPSRQPKFEGGEGMGTVSVEMLVIAVVEAEDVSVGV